jgi:hypothetical protein
VHRGAPRVQRNSFFSGVTPNWIFDLALVINRILDIHVKRGKEPRNKKTAGVFLVNQEEDCSMGHNAWMTVPFPGVVSILKDPPESSTLSLILVSPNPFLELF